MPPIALLVGDESKELQARGLLLAGHGYLVSVATSFEQAKRRLSLAPPDLLVTNLRLGAFNGLHLVIRGRLDHPTMAAIVLDSRPDAGRQSDAVAAGAAYLLESAEPEQFLAMADQLVKHRPERPSSHTARRWPRKPIGPVRARLGRQEARLTDLSYGGARVELDQLDIDSLASDAIELMLPDAGASVRTRAIWAKRPTAGGAWWCGLQLDEVETGAGSLRAWRHLVDGLV